MTDLDNTTFQSPGLSYNTMLPKLPLPEYGRNIQQMVDHCLTIPDKGERTRAANTIVKAMIALNPRIREQEGWQQKLWDHLALMSGFSLDIDWPFPPVTEDVRHSEPDKVPYPTATTTYRNYGRSIQRLISKACLMEPGDERDTLVLLLANQMKKVMLGLNKDYVEDRRIFKDLAAMSHGQILLDADKTRLCDFHILPTSSKKKKKK